MLRYRWHRNTITDGDRSHTVVRRVAPGSKAGNDGGADSTTEAIEFVKPCEGLSKNTRDNKNMTLRTHTTLP